MRRALLLLGLAPLLPAFSCGDLGNGDVIDVDPAFFAALRFDCDPQTPAPSCPPFSCDVNEDGTISDGACNEACELDPSSSVITTSFAYQGPEGVDLCAPRECVVSAENTAPDCSVECSPNDVTTFVFEYGC